MQDGQELSIERNPLAGDETGAENPASPDIVLRRKQPYLLAIPILAVFIVLAVIIFVDKPTDFEQYIKENGYTGVLLMAVIGSTSPIWPMPGSWAAFIAGGFGLNPFLLALLAGIGETFGEMTAYFAGYGGQGTVSKWKRYAQIERWTARYGGLTIFLTSAIPNIMIKFVIIAAGAIGYPMWKFFLLCWSGKTIKSFAFAMAGAGLFRILIHLIS